MAIARLEIECPRCDNVESEEIDDLEAGSIQIECPVCHASVEATYTISVELDGVEVTETPPVEFDCPECDCSMCIDDISSESGEEEVECESDECGAVLTVRWSDWGEDVEVEASTKTVEVAEEPEEEEEEEEESRRSGRARWPSLYEVEQDDEDEEDEDEEDDWW